MNSRPKAFCNAHTFHVTWTQLHFDWVCKQSQILFNLSVFGLIFLVFISPPSLQLPRMKLLIVSCVLFCLIALSNGAERAVWIAGESGIHPDHPGKCWSQSLERELAVGEEVTDKSKCELIKCGPTFRFSRRV